MAAWGRGHAEKMPKEKAPSTGGASQKQGPACAKALTWSGLGEVYGKQQTNKQQNRHVRLAFVILHPSCHTMDSQTVSHEPVFARHMCCCQTQDKPVARFQLMSPSPPSPKKKHLIHPSWPPRFPKEDPAANSLFIIISLWPPPSALDPGRSWHRHPWTIKPYILFNLLSSDMGLRSRASQALGTL